MVEKRKGSYLLIYCILRIGLVMTAKMSLFSLQYVIIISFFVILLRYGNPLIKQAIASVSTIVLLLEIFYIFILKFFTLNASYINTEVVYIKQLFFLLLLFFMYFYINSCDNKSQRLYIGVYLFCVGVSACYTLYVSLSSDVRVIRNTAFGVYDKKFALEYGGYDFIYGLVIIYVVLATVIRHNSFLKKKTKTMLILYILLLASTIIASGFSTAFVLIFVYSIFEFVPGKYVKFIVLPSVVLLVYLFPGVVSSVINAIPFIPEITSTRVTNTILSFLGKDTSEYFTQEGQRFDRTLWSLHIFIEHPIFGGFAGNTFLPFGYHTEWIEQMARYGIFATLLNSTFWLNTFIRIKNSMNENDLGRRCVRNAFVVFFLLGFFNPISMVVTAAPLFVLCPFVSESFNDYS